MAKANHLHWLPQWWKAAHDQAADDAVSERLGVPTLGPFLIGPQPQLTRENCMTRYLLELEETRSERPGDVAEGGQA